MLRQTKAPLALSQVVVPYDPRIACLLLVEPNPFIHFVRFCNKDKARVITKSSLETTFPTHETKPPVIPAAFAAELNYVRNLGSL